MILSAPRTAIGRMGILVSMESRNAPFWKGSRVEEVLLRVPSGATTTDFPFSNSLINLATLSLLDSVEVRSTQMANFPTT